MKTWSIEQILKATHGKLISQKETVFFGLGTDTRIDLSGQFFVALRGDQFDAHQFLNQAIGQKAAALIVDQEKMITEDMKSKVSIILVQDTLKALQDLARFHRARFQGLVVGITGSNGKTSSKEFMASTISQSKKVFYSKGSFNNHWGVPMSLLEIKDNPEVALIEMGMNHAGEITDLVNIANPDIVICTMVGRAHIEHFGSIEKIAEAKEEIYIASSKKAVRIYNLDNPLTYKMYQKSVAQYPESVKITFSEFDSKADVCLKVQEMTLDSLNLKGHIQGYESEVTVPVFGLQNRVNLMAAAAGALACGLAPKDVWLGLKKCKTIWGRNQLLQTSNQVQILFDGYNANPDSMKALLENAKKIKNQNRKIGVFGQMLEMGSGSAQFHFELGEQAAQAGLNEVYFYGADFESFKEGCQKVNTELTVHVQKEFTPSFADQLANSVKSQDLVFVKGSRGMRLERMVLPLKPIGFDV